MRAIIVRKSEAATRLIVWGTVITALAVLLASPASAVAGAIPDILTFSPKPAPLPPSSTQTQTNWHHFMAIKPTPKAGCYTAHYPSREWQEVPCSTAAPQPHPLSNVGNGGTASGSLSSADGRFYSVTGGPPNSNIYSLQLNVNTFPTTSLCPKTASCTGWQQYLYDNNGNSSQLYIQYWLFGFPNSTCPTSTFASHTWQYYNGQGGGAAGCFINGNQTPVDNQTSQNFPSLHLFGFANTTASWTNCNSSQGCQVADLETGYATNSNAYKAMDNGDLLGIGSNWNTTEYNVVGLCCLQKATFNAGSTIVVQLDVNLNNGAAALPNCLAGGYTAETNSLTVINPCCPVQLGPPGFAQEAVNRVLFTQSNAPGATSLCACSAGSYWSTNEQACITPQEVPQNPACFSGFLWCARLKECVTPGIFATLCTIRRR